MDMRQPGAVRPCTKCRDTTAGEPVVIVSVPLDELDTQACQRHVTLKSTRRWHGRCFPVEDWRHILIDIKRIRDGRPIIARPGEHWVSSRRCRECEKRILMDHPVVMIHSPSIHVHVGDGYDGYFGIWHAEHFGPERFRSACSAWEIRSPYELAADAIRRAARRH